MYAPITSGLRYALKSEAPLVLALFFNIICEILATKTPATKTIEKTGAREISLWQSGLERNVHIAEITVISGKIGIDGIQIEDGKED